MPHDNVDEKTTEKILIGKIVNAVGLKGEVKVYNYSDSPAIYEETPEIYVDDVLMPVRSVGCRRTWSCWALWASMTGLLPKKPKAVTYS